MSISLKDQNNNPKEDHRQYYDIFKATSDYESGDIITYSRSNGISEIEEEEEDDVSNGVVEELYEARKFAPMPSIREEHDKRSVASAAEDCIHVAVGKSLSSAQALDWALRNALDSPSTVLYLIHIFPETKQIPTPLGKLPMSQVSPEQVESFMAQERGKRRELLQKFINKCSSFNVNVDTILIESDGLPQAILDLVDILHIRKLVVGTTKSSLRKLRSRKGTGTADLILKGAPETCELKIICDGTEVVVDNLTVESPLSHRGNDLDISKEFDKSISIRENEVHEVEKMDDGEKRDEATTSCMCFK